MHLKLKLFAIITAFTISNSSCKKNGFLNERPASNLNIPSTLSDLQSLLDYSTSTASEGMNQAPGIGEASSDIYQLPYSTWLSASAVVQNAYTWAKDTWQGQGMQRDWNSPYSVIFKSNYIIERLKDILPDSTASSKATWNYIKGQAHFFRANAYWNLAQVFCPYYDSATATSDLGLPLKLSSDINALEDRSTLKKTYEQIFSDLNIAGNLLNISLPGNLKNRPSKIAYYSLMARIYLNLRNYVLAGKYADSSLSNYSTLIDFNTLSTTSSAPITFTNSEVVFQAYCMSNTSSTMLQANSTIGLIDTALYNSYSANDLRKIIFFRVNSNGTISRKYDWAGESPIFAGLATHEQYLIRAECYARAGNITEAMKDLNNLLRMRWKKVGGITTYVDKIANTTSEALNIILVERKKEMLFRQRWSDLRRLNKEGANITLTKNLNGQIYTLPPNSPLYVLPIPPDEISLSGIQQNAR